MVSITAEEQKAIIKKMFDTYKQMIAPFMENTGNEPTPQGMAIVWNIDDRDGATALIGKISLQMIEQSFVNICAEDIHARIKEILLNETKKAI